MKQIVALVGSLREESVNRQVFLHYKSLSKPYFELTEGIIADIPLYNQDIAKEPDSVVKLAQQIKQADGVIFFSPEYNYSIPGGLKNAIDWMSRNTSQPFDGKLSAIIGASPGQMGTARMQYQLRQVGVFLNIYFMNRPEIMITNAYEKVRNGQVIDPPTVEFLKNHISSFVDFLEM